MVDWGWGFSSAVERLPSERKALGSVPSSEKKKKKYGGQQRRKTGLYFSCIYVRTFMQISRRRVGSGRYRKIQKK